jgi:membrane dipeptidase
MTDLPLIVDAHEDLAWNALVFGRDYTQSALETRRRETAEKNPALEHNGQCCIGLPEWLAGRVAVVFGTLYAAPARRRQHHVNSQTYETADQAHTIGLAQMDYYRRLAAGSDSIRLIGKRNDLEAVLATWADDQPEDSHQVGLVPLMEGADLIREPEEAGFWFDQGLRIVGLAWAATRYAGGTGEPGPLTEAGYRLLDAMAAAGLMLDLSHAAEEAYFQALDRFEGTVMVTHANPRRFLPTDRGLSDEMIQRLVARGGVVGIVPYNAFLQPGWKETRDKQAVTLTDVVTAIDHVCQLVGDTAHVGLGSDFDGGLGAESIPAEMDTVADLAKLAPALRARGYAEADVARIMGGNWLRVLRARLPGDDPVRE